MCKQWRKMNLRSVELQYWINNALWRIFLRIIKSFIRGCETRKNVFPVSWSWKLCICNKFNILCLNWVDCLIVVLTEIFSFFHSPTRWMLRCPLNICTQVTSIPQTSLLLLKCVYCSSPTWWEWFRFVFGEISCPL